MISKNQIKLIRQLEQKKYRVREGLFVAEGPKVVGDLLRKMPAEALFATADYLEESGMVDGTMANLRGTTVHEVSADELHRISFLQHPQQVLALFRLPDVSQPLLSLPWLNQGLSLVLDGVQDPGNLGTIIRLADWFGIDCVFCSEHTADAWNPKVVQATMGSIARVPIVYGSLEELLTHTSLPVYGTLLDGSDLYAQQLSPNGLIVMGSEGTGISAPIRKLITHRLLIPRYGSSDGAESLNVAIATSIVCAEFRRACRPISPLV